MNQLPRLAALDPVAQGVEADVRGIVRFVVHAERRAVQSSTSAAGGACLPLARSAGIVGATMDMTLEPQWEEVGIDGRYNWRLPLTSRPEHAGPRAVWYVGLPLTSAHRDSHSGGGALIPGVVGQERYLNEGTVYPYASLMELITYHVACFPISLEVSGPQP